MKIQDLRLGDVIARRLDGGATALYIINDTSLAEYGHVRACGVLFQPDGSVIGISPRDYLFGDDRTVRDCTRVLSGPAVAASAAEAEATPA